MELVKQSLNNSVQIFSSVPRRKHKHDLEVSLVKVRPKIYSTLVAQSSYSFKYQVAAHVQLKKVEYDERGEYTIRYIDPHFTSDSFYYDEDEGEKELDILARQITARFDSFIQNGSGWLVDEILEFSLKVFRIKHFQGGGGVKNTSLPKVILNKKACISIKNTRDKCFVYSCLAHIHPVKRHPEFTHHYDRYWHELNLDGLSYPTPIKQVRVFERNNTHLSVNILGYEAGVFIPLHRTINRNVRHKRKTITLLLYKGHYYLVRNVSRLLNHQDFKRRGRSTSWYCHSCLCRYDSLQSLRDHENLCRDQLQNMTVPSPKQIKFEHYRRMFMLQFVIYYDIEVILRPDPSTTKVDHVPISVCSYTKCLNDEHTRSPVIFTGTDCIDLFLQHLKIEENRIVNILRTENSELKCDSDDDARIMSTLICDICKRPFQSDDKKYRDHDHLNHSSTSNMRFVTCNRCNLTYGSQNYKIPVVAHNANRYDIHHIVLGLKDASRVKVLAKNSESFISLTWGKRLSFIDSFNFLAGSLDGMTRTLPPDSVTPFLDHITTDETLQKLLMHKGIFPYDYIDHLDKLKDCRLPSKEKFYNSLTNRHVDGADYERAQRVWNEFDCQTLKDYLELYVCLDTLLLAAMVESYRVSTHKHFRLDPMHYVSSPSLCFDAMLKITEVELDTLPSVDMYLFFTKAIRGGIAGASTRRAVANNDCCEDYDPTEPVSHIIGLDANNLYGHSLCQSLPTGEFRWMTKDQLDSFDVANVPEDGDYGYFLEVDLQYPDCVHDLHNDYPLAPEKLDIPAEQWSKHTKLLAEMMNTKHKSSGTKLMSTLRDKTRYILHYENLKLYTRLGMRLVTLHRGISFRQSPFLKPYILLNNKARTSATSSFEINLYKGYNNYIFGKTCYNVFKQIDLKLVTDDDKFQRLAGRPTFHSSHVISERLVSVQMTPKQIVCDKPVYIGATVLDLSKKHMYSFYYDFLVPRYHDSGLRMIYTDTDSFYLQIFNRPDFYNDILLFERFFDRSAYPEHHFLRSDKRKRELGLMKDVHAEGHITDIVALRSKMYAVRVQGPKRSVGTDLKAKGVKRDVLKQLKFDNYVRCLLETSVTTHRFKQIRSFRHHLVTKDCNKIGLSSYDDKRYLLPCGTHSYAYGHFRSKASTVQCSHCD